jgi:hypothetical protein
LVCKETLAVLPAEYMSGIVLHTVDEYLTAMDDRR